MPDEREAIAPMNTLRQTPVELMPCPFCGKQPRACPDTSYGAATVYCPDVNECSVAPQADADLVAGETLDDAVAKWNTRTPTPATTATVKDLIAELESLEPHLLDVVRLDPAAKRLLAVLAAPAPVDVELRAAFELWFFRELTEDTRKVLYRLCGYSDCLDEIRTHSTEQKVLRAIIAALLSRS
jgi:hypothetical protein